MFSIKDKPELSRTRVNIYASVLTYIVDHDEMLNMKGQIKIMFFSCNLSEKSRKGRGTARFCFFQTETITI